MIKHVSNKIQNAIQMELFKAKESIKIVVAWFTNDLLLQHLILKLQNGVSVDLIINDDEINRGGESSLDFTEYLEAGGILRWNDSKQLTHEKFCIIDNRIVIAGSYNWTNKAEYNSEVETFYYDEKDTTQFFYEIFEILSAKFKEENREVNPIVEIEKEVGHIDDDGYYIDQYGAKYSGDKKVLYKGADVEVYAISESTTKIEGHAFEGYRKLKLVYLPNGIKRIYRNTFKNCSALIQAFIPESVVSIDAFAFECCSSLKTIFIPDSVERIGSCAFSECSSLKYVRLPHSADLLIEDMAFRHCTSLKTIDGLYTDIGYATFKNCTSLEDIYLSNTIKSIGESAFENCQSLRSITLPKSLKSIGKGAFSGCWTLKEIHIPPKVESIGQRVFDGCTYLKKVFIPMGTKSKYIGVCGAPDYTEYVER